MVLRYQTNTLECNACDNQQCGEGEFRTGRCSGTKNGFGCKACANAVCKINQYR